MIANVKQTALTTGPTIFHFSLLLNFENRCNKTKPSKSIDQQQQQQQQQKKKHETDNNLSNGNFCEGGNELASKQRHPTLSDRHAFNHKTNLKRK